MKPASASDRSDVAALRADPAKVGAIGATCVVTQISGGPAPNAVPQRAEADINCRIFPGHKPAEILAQLKAAAGRSRPRARSRPTPRRCGPTSRRR